MTRFLLPDLGEGLQEAELVAWHVAEGDHVVVDQPLVSVETEKAVVEVPSPCAGRISKILVAPGEHLKVGAPLVEFEEGPRQDVGAIVGDLSSHPADRPAPAPEPMIARAKVSESRVKVAPAVRTLAHERGIDLSRVVPSGPEGTITRDDVLKAVSAQQTEAHHEPLRGVRLSMARNMALSRSSVVPATLFDEVDVETWWNPSADVTMRLIRAIVAGCAASPSLNAWFDDEKMERILHAHVDIGIAVDTELGLIVPVVRDAGKCDAAALRRSLNALKSAVRSRTVTPNDLRNPTITLSNFGTLGGGRHATLVVLSPQVAIVGAGRISAEAVPGPGGATFHHVLPLSVTFDHRVVTGGEAARFLKAMVADLEQSA